MSRGFRLAPLFVVVAVVVVGNGCPAPAQGSTAEEGAAHLGLLPGTTFTYAAGEGLTETHEVKSSDVLFAGGLAVDVVARANGFAEEARTMTFGIDVAQVSLLRFFDCLSVCAQPDQPIPFLNWPLQEGDVVTGEAVVTETRGGESVVRSERYTTTVNAPASIEVEAGVFDAYAVAWARTTLTASGEESTEIALLHLAADVGVVRHEAFDGTRLELVERAGP